MRRPTPRCHVRSSAHDVANWIATRLTEPVSNTASSASKTNPTECVLLGRASQGSTRSRWPHMRQRASHTASRPSADSRVRSQRHTRAPVSRSSALPQPAHTQSASTSSRPLATCAS